MIHFEEFPTDRMHVPSPDDSALSDIFAVLNIPGRAGRICAFVLKTIAGQSIYPVATECIKAQGPGP